MEFLQLNEVDIVIRALALRKRRLIGVLWAESGRYYISENELDPFGSRVRVSLARLGEVVEENEAAASRKAVACETRPAKVLAASA